MNNTTKLLSAILTSILIISSSFAGQYTGYQEYHSSRQSSEQYQNKARSIVKSFFEEASSLQSSDLSDIEIQSTIDNREIASAKEPTNVKANQEDLHKVVFTNSNREIASAVKQYKSLITDPHSGVLILTNKNRNLAAKDKVVVKEIPRIAPKQTLKVNPDQNQIVTPSNSIAKLIKLKVKPGDWLSKYSQYFYGNPYEYQRIVDFNSNISNPHVIEVGQIVKIPLSQREFDNFKLTGKSEIEFNNRAYASSNNKAHSSKYNTIAAAKSSNKTIGDSYVEYSSPPLESKNSKSASVTSSTNDSDFDVVEKRIVNNSNQNLSTDSDFEEIEVGDSSDNLDNVYDDMDVDTDEGESRITASNKQANKATLNKLILLLMGFVVLAAIMLITFMGRKTEDQNTDNK